MTQTNCKTLTRHSDLANPINLPTVWPFSLTRAHTVALCYYACQRFIHVFQFDHLIDINLGY